MIPKSIEADNAKARSPKPYTLNTIHTYLVVSISVSMNKPSLCRPKTAETTHSVVLATVEFLKMFRPWLDLRVLRGFRIEGLGFGVQGLGVIRG